LGYFTNLNELHTSHECKLYDDYVSLHFNLDRPQNPQFDSLSMHCNLLDPYWNWSQPHKAATVWRHVLPSNAFASATCDQTTKVVLFQFTHDI